MIASARVFPDTSRLLPSVAARPAPSQATAEGENSASFQDFLDQQGGKPYPPPVASGVAVITPRKVTGSQEIKDVTSNVDSQGDDSDTASSEGEMVSSENGAELTGTTSEPGNVQSKSMAPTLPSGSQLGAMMVRAAILAGGAAKVAISKTPSLPAAKTPTGPEKKTAMSANTTTESLPVTSSSGDSSASLVQPFFLPSPAKQPPTTKVTSSSSKPAHAGENGAAAAITPPSSQAFSAQAVSVARSVARSATATLAGDGTAGTSALPQEVCERGESASTSNALPGATATTTPAPKKALSVSAPTDSPAALSASSEKNSPGAALREATMEMSRRQRSTISDAPGSASSAVAPGKDLPVSTPVDSSTTPPATEKKSTATNVEGSFLQPTASSSTNASEAALLAYGLGVSSDSFVNQKLTPTVSSTNNAPSDPLSASAPLAGTANVEKGSAMNTDLHLPEVQLLSGLGANAASSQNAPDLHIQLSSNNDFTDALKQVMHVAQLSQTNESVTPMRVEMEIQTPPGAIVNVYVSRQNDQWRAQLSTNDPQALSWVQDQMSALRGSNDLGGDVRWLPPQMESTPTLSSGQDANLTWDRGGQGQSSYQQPDDRQPSQRQKQTDDKPGATPKSNLFMNALTSLGRTA